MTDTLAVDSARVERILDELPQTQCTRCGYGGCRPYAEALAGGAAINRCPPGGESTIRALAHLIGAEAVPLDPEVGATPVPATAFIREDECIGCFKCVRACPVDAILGAPRLMHTVIIAECTGCELCVAPCPVDCIEMRPLEPGTPLPWSAARARQRVQARSERLALEEAQSLAKRAARAASHTPEARAAAVRNAVQRARERRAATDPDNRD